MLGSLIEQDGASDHITATLPRVPPSQSYLRVGHEPHEGVDEFGGGEIGVVQTGNWG